MAWGRYYFGRVSAGGLVHVVYEHGKDERKFWSSQCNVVWGTRAYNTPAPKIIWETVTCLRCIAQEWTVKPS